MKKQKFNAKLKLNIVLIVILSTLLSVGLFLIHKKIQKTALAELKKQATLQMDMAHAVRSYTSDYIKPNVDNQIKFHNFSVPAFAANTTMKILTDSNPDFKYQEVATNPTNLRNKANAWQQQIINYLGQNLSLKEYFKISQDSFTKEEVLNFVKPLKVSSQSCLNCHGRPSDAPVSQLNLYGNQNGFNWKADEVIGIQIVSIPTKNMHKQIQASFNNYIFLSIIIFTTVFTVLNIMLTNVVINPIEKNKDALEKLSHEDHLTGAYNRRWFESQVHKILEIKKPIHVVLLDIDHFKKINDTYGHNIGDVVLKEFAQLISQKLSKNNHFSRIGGEEFVFISTQTDTAIIHSFCENLKSIISNHKFAEVGHVTVSIGIAQSKLDENLDEILSHADEALYIAKKMGRNRVETHSNHIHAIAS